ncbi:zinc-binding alcohol dehydrogenase family protein [Sporosarcina pasteurii]|uniref:Sorbitol dehydrogenase n=1 Tax=Sporosarcina pasteurii TaxID=1474 RepID=A0A380BRD6_SPOPA|nr:zinc-binding alcohol dehydrogenase family protein [Sporosarcina pasteurii]MDS9471203.1 zinc-binding alcohol dehydrogenase family protein [Sporosarcina pasteurii]QBQ05161.1 zinc-binding alcohol dehydrogenase family protein [Sporosarcina pasteurii]SUJ05554.1 Sorbitol dehydrogenase [Sporosarcina pasteurii]
MKAVRIPEANIIEVIDIPEPEIKQANEVKVKIKRVGICGSDMHIYHGTNPLATYPRIVGHEVTGEIVAIGANVKNVAIGDHVVVEPISYCGTCYACKNGRPNVCKEVSVFGVHEDGGMREFVILSDKQVHKVNANIDWDEAVMAEPYTIGAQATWRGNVGEGQTVFIQGAGPIGITVLKMAKLRGATVIISDYTNERLEFAQENGADYTINPSEVDVEDKVNEITDDEGANVVIDAVGLPQTFELSVSVASAAGNVVLLGFNATPSAIAQMLITKKELTITGSRLQTNQFGKVVELINDEKLTHNGLITHRFPLSQIKEAFEFVEQNPQLVRKAVIEFN